MKRILIFALIFGLILAVVSPGASAGESNTKQGATAVRNIQLLANALELYANDHHREYPSERVFYQARYGRGDFSKYIRTALGKSAGNLGDYFLCDSGQLLSYRPFTDTLGFKLSCPRPERFGMKALYFSTAHGLVRDTGTVNKGIEVKKEAPKDQWEQVSEEERQEIVAVLTSLWEAYNERDIDRVMDLQKVAVERAAREMEQKGPYSADDVRDAFRGTAQDLFDTHDFQMEPLNIAGLKYEKKQNTYQVSSFIPILASNKVQVASLKVRLKVGNIQLEKIEGNFVITHMQMY